MGKRVGVLGSGDVAKTLAKGFAAKGYEVMIGSRDPKKLADFAKEQGIAYGSFPETASHGEVVVLAVKGTAAIEAISLAGEANLSGKLVFDTTNPIAESPPVNGVLVYFTGANDSLMERLQKAQPKTFFVKAWNSIGSAYMVDPKFAGGPPSMFIAGDNEGAKKEAAEILTSFGFEPEDMGKVESARAIEPLCQLWCAPGMLRKQWSHAFKLVRPA
jgi:hypothetical protein